ncbi:MAG: response regulator [Verrucomicrobia bacterium]|nr:response regulator [Verrucomicrobiota bacterium]
MSKIKKSPKPPEKKAPAILVVDDEPMIGEVVKAILEMEGFQVEVFRDPTLALAALQKSRQPDLLLTDFVMPSLNGMELIEQAKKANPGLKTILFSGNFGNEIMRYYPVKPDQFLSKPFQPKVLTAMIKSVLAE